MQSLPGIINNALLRPAWGPLLCGGAPAAAVRLPLRLLIQAMLLFGMFLGSAARPAVAEANREYKVKAAFVASFIDFVKWNVRRVDVTEDFSICLFRSDPFEQSLERIVALKYPQRSIRIVRLHDLRQVETCHMLFVSVTEENVLREVLSQTSGKPVLTVSDIPGFAGSGGMIELLVENGKVRFNINLRPVRQAGMQLSSNLLRLALRVLNPIENAGAVVGRRLFEG
jgi:hypothetical protein